MGAGAPMKLHRRALLAAAASLPFAACRRSTEPHYGGGWVGAQHERGHRLRDLKSGSLPTPAVQRRVGVLIVGGGVAGLACARALARRGIDDVHLLDLEDAAGGNSRGHQLAGMACPLGAHYLPVPGEHDTEVIELLQELGVSHIENGKRVYDERHLCHSPQERLFIDGQWQEGLLPVQGQSEETLAQYRRFSELVASASDTLGFSLPTARSPWAAAHAALDATPFNAWLDAQGLTAEPLRTHLDYCCRDDYGAGAAQVSAWAGLHYFASRHGFRVPGAPDAEEREGVLTWPQGNAWLTERLAAPLRDRLHTGKLVLRVDEGRHDVSVDVWDATAQRSERWTATRVVMATPLFISTRVLASPPAALQSVASQLRYAPWLVANLHLEQVLHDAGGAPPSWDNVIHASPSLGYVNAMHQSTRPHPGPTVLTSYWALGGDSAAQLQAQRTRLLQEDWSVWARRVLDDLAQAHPDLPGKVKRIDLMRYGHAMSIPVPGVRSSPALKAMSQFSGRVQFAHSDLAGYSVFEEAFFHGHRVGNGLTS
ncbi:MAG: FAD-dependent oxidoreductase [Cytophagales bacterium]|nr:FAD-dependent oxidoreductase [Rhizobacter sp.]